ncbi:MAG: ACP S-malonyltransferase, partial [Terriglobia bacterium]
EAGALTLRDALLLVRKRGEYMQQAVPVGEGAMAALLGGAQAAAEAVCREAAQGEICSPANLNSPGQVVIAGHAAAVRRAVELAPRHGIRRAVVLNVSAPFHCSLMQPAAEKLARDLDATEISAAAVPLVNNVDAAAVQRAEAIRDGLKRQVTASVRWEESIRTLLASQVDLFIEAGPGTVLSGLMRQIDRGARCLPAGDKRSLEEALVACAGRC